MFAERQEIGGRCYALDPVSFEVGRPRAGVLFLAVAAGLSPLILALLLILLLVMAFPVAAVGQSVTARFLPSVMRRLGRRFVRERSELLRDICGRVLDVGAGSGEYLPHYLAARGPVSEVVLLEPLEALHATLLKRVRGSAAPFRVRITGDAVEVLASDPGHAGTYDWAVLGNVLCEVPCQRRALAALDRLLKPGGRVYFSEHVACARGSWTRWFQDLVNPLWRLLSGGCNCNRETLRALEATGYDIAVWHFDVRGTFFVTPFVLGIAQKPPRKGA